MARLILLVLLVLLTAPCVAGSTANQSSHAKHDITPIEFIKSSCKATRYPSLCVRSLAGYAKTIRGSRPRQMVRAALSVSLAKSRSAAAFVSKMAQQAKGLNPRAHQAVKDCLENMGEAVERLGSSVKELGQTGRAGSPSFMWHISNLQTWVSAALTDENTCIDGLQGDAMDGVVAAKAAIRGRIFGVIKVTSNALALVNQFAERQHVDATEKLP